MSESKVIDARNVFPIGKHCPNCGHLFSPLQLNLANFDIFRQHHDGKVYCVNCDKHQVKFDGVHLVEGDK